MEYITTAVFSIFVYDNETNNSINKNYKANPLFWGLNPYEKKSNSQTTTNGNIQNQSLVSDDSSINSNYSQNYSKTISKNTYNNDKTSSFMIGGFNNDINQLNENNKLDKTINNILNI